MPYTSRRYSADTIVSTRAVTSGRAIDELSKTIGRRARTRNCNITDLPTSLFFRFAILIVLYLCFSVGGYPQNGDESDLTGAFGRHLGEYSINQPRKPKGLSDFKNFVLEEPAGQNIDHPKTDSKRRTFVNGTVSLVNGTTLRLKSAWLKMNRDGKYEWLQFVTETVNGEYFRFDGYFLRKRVDDVPNIDTYLRGTLQRFRNGKRLAKANLPFTIYADM